MKSTPIIVIKEVGETPLECIERFRLEQGIASQVPLTYAGRLDPMAQGKLLVLVGEDCKDKDTYLALDKEYDVDVTLGIRTDTYDVLGRISDVIPDFVSAEYSSKENLHLFLKKYIGTFEQEYPIFSSRTVAGVALHTLARSNSLPDDMPSKEVTIYTIESNMVVDRKRGEDIALAAIAAIRKVHGDFRQEAILNDWESFKRNHGESMFDVLHIKVRCSSGTYMRSLAHRIGEDLGCGAIASLISRTRVGQY